MNIEGMCASATACTRACACLHSGGRAAAGLIFYRFSGLRIATADMLPPRNGVLLLKESKVFFDGPFSGT